MKTASSESDDARTAPKISCIASRAPSSGGIPFSWMNRAMFSITTIASSTTSPVASVKPNSVSVLIEKPNIFIKKNVPISETGIVIAGISVVRQSWRNKKITSTTRKTAISSVITTSRIDSRTNSVESKATWYVIPAGNFVCSRSSVARICCETCSALPVCSCRIPRPIPSRPSNHSEPP